MRNSLITALAAGAVISLAAVTAEAQLLPHAPVVDHLPNGLTVITVPYDSPGIAAYFTLVRTGARDEVERSHSGFAHLFEHMMFRGTQSVSATEYEHRMQALSADNNAYTTEDYTLYTITLPTTSLAGLVPIEADRFAHLSYTEPVFQTETRAVLGEYNKNSSSPLTPMYEALSELGFTRHTYGHTTLGYLADIQAMLNTLIPKELEVQTQSGQWYTMRIQAYRTLYNVIEGAVISFVDITALVKSRDDLRRSNGLQRLGVALHDASDAITVQDLDGRILAWNPGAVRLYGWSETQALAMNVRDRIPAALRGQALATLTQLSKAKIIEPYRTQRLARDGAILEVSMVSTALVNEAGQMYAIATTERAIQAAD